MVIVVVVVMVFFVSWVRRRRVVSHSGGWSREDRRQFVQVHDGGRVARLQPQRLAVRGRRLLVFPVQVEDRAQVRVAARLVRPQPRRVPVPHLRVLQPARLPKRGRRGHRQLVIGSRKLRRPQLLLGRLRQSALGRQEQSCEVTSTLSNFKPLYTCVYIYMYIKFGSELSD